MSNPKAQSTDRLEKQSQDIEGLGQSESPGAQQDPPAGENQHDASHVERLTQELDAAKEQALRAHAELENVRKRQQRELEETRRYAALPLMRSLLEVVDNLDRAIQAGEQTADPKALLDGVKMVARQLHEILRAHHCTEIEALHEPFDPNKHEAVQQRAHEEKPASTVIEVVQPGFQLHERVVRPAQVVVSSGPPQKEEKQNE